MSGEKGQKTKSSQKKADQQKYFYVDEGVGNYDYSDFVKLDAFPRGIKLSFGKWYPDKKKFGLFREILLPFDVADALKNVIEKQIADLVDKGLLEIKEGKQT